MAIKAKHIQSAKTQAIAETKALLEGYNDFIFTDYRGLTVAQISNLRKQLREKQSAVKVVKNNFAKLAFEELKVSSVADFLTGPTAVVLSKEDTNEVAKVLYGFAEEAPVLKIKGGVVANEVYDSAKLKAFSALPGKKQLIAMIASTINAPVQKLAATIQAYVDKKTKEEGASQAS